MGDVADYMDEDFLKKSFKAMDEEVLYVKVIMNKYTGLRAGYCFVHFRDGQTALRVMHKLNGKMIPYTQPPVRFMLNHSNANKTNQEREYSLWVGDLDMSVNDEELYKAFATRYNTIRAARVVLDKTTGVSRGYAFVRFGNQEEHKDALTHMHGFKGLANKAIRVSVAVPKRPIGSGTGTSDAATANGGGGDYSAYYEQYWYNYQAWQNYGSYDPSAYQAGMGYDHLATGTAGAAAGTAEEEGEEDDTQVVEHDVPVDVERQNRDYVMRNEELWDALDASRWLQPDVMNPDLQLSIKT